MERSHLQVGVDGLKIDGLLARASLEALCSLLDPDALCTAKIWLNHENIPA